MAEGARCGMDDVGAWRARATAMLRAELKLRRITHGELAARLAARGTRLTRASLYNRIGRGTFSAAFFLQCLDAIGSERVRPD